MMASEAQTSPPDDASPSSSEGTSSIGSPAATIHRSAIIDNVDHGLQRTPARLWDKLKRHKVAEWTLAYGAFAYAFLHLTEMLSEALEWPHGIVRVVSLSLILGVPVAATLAWFHGHRAQHRVSRSELAILIVLLVAGGTVLWFYSRSGSARISAPAATSVISAPVPSIGTPAFNPPAHSIAVLPFTNLSGDPKQEYFSDGMSEELINALSQINSLQVIARASSFSFKGDNSDIRTIARKLNVGAILEGSVRRSGDTVRITAELINAVSGFDIWSQDYDRSLKNVLELQSDIATSVAQQLQAKLLGDESARIGVGGTHNTEAHDAYLRGMQWLLASQGPSGNRSAVAMFDRAIALDDHYAYAYADRAGAEANIAADENDVPARRTLFMQARRDAERALTLAPDLAEAHAVLGYAVLLWGFQDFVHAGPEIERAYELAPGSVAELDFRGAYEGYLGHTDEAIGALQRAIELDPLTFYHRNHFIGALIGARRFTEALAAVSDAKAVPHSSTALEFHSFESYLGLGQTQRARMFCESPTNHLADDDRQYCLALAYHALGMAAAAEAALRKFRALDADAAAYQYAQIFAQWDDRNAALQWLKTSVRLNDPGLLSVEVDWMLDPIRDAPEFKVLERRLNFPP